MAGWLGPLIVAGAIAVGAAVGLLLAYLLIRIQRRRWLFSRKHEFPTPNTKEIEGLGATQPDSLNEFAEKYKVKIAELKTASLMHDTLQKPAQKSPAILLPVEQVRAKKSEALIELETNLEIATALWTGKLVSFQTKVWDTQNSEFDLLRESLKDELTEAYADMRMANNIVWLSTEIGRASKDLEASYIKLCVMITQRLKSVIPSLKEATDKRTP